MLLTATSFAIREIAPGEEIAIDYEVVEGARPKAYEKAEHLSCGGGGTVRLAPVVCSCVGTRWE